MLAILIKNSMYSTKNHYNHMLLLQHISSIFLYRAMFVCLFYWTHRSDLCAPHNSLLINLRRKLQITTPYRIATGNFHSTGEITQIHPGHD